MNNSLEESKSFNNTGTAAKESQPSNNTDNNSVFVETPHEANAMLLLLEALTLLHGFDYNEILNDEGEMSTDKDSDEQKMELDENEETAAEAEALTDSSLDSKPLADNSLDDPQPSTSAAAYAAASVAPDIQTPPKPDETDAKPTVPLKSAPFVWSPGINGFRFISADDRIGMAVHNEVTDCAQVIYDRDALLSLDDDADEFTEIYVPSHKTFMYGDRVPPPQKKPLNLHIRRPPPVKPDPLFKVPLPKQETAEQKRLAHIIEQLRLRTAQQKYKRSLDNEDTVVVDNNFAVKVERAKGNQRNAEREALKILAQAIASCKKTTDDAVQPGPGQGQCRK